MSVNDMYLGRMRIDFHTSAEIGPLGRATMSRRGEPNGRVC
jgi:hypothetical protein